VKFVEGFADKLEVPAGERDSQAFDDELPGFGIRKFDSGVASYFVKFNVGRQQRRKTLGRVVRGNLKAMRLQASQILAKARLGIDTVAETRAAAAKRTATLGELVPQYLAVREAGEEGWLKLRPKSLTEVTRYLERDWQPLHKLPIDGITRQGIEAVVDDLARDGGRVAADHARIALSGLCAWAIGKQYLKENPTINIKPRADGAARTQTLSEAQLAEVWANCLDDDYGHIVRLLILTAQRRVEIGDLRWSEIDFGRRQLEIPAARCKNGRAMLKNGIASHVVPLSRDALSILERLKPSKTRDAVFGIRASGFCRWSQSKLELEERIAHARRKAGIKDGMPEWRLHDIRRSVVTALVESRERTGKRGKVETFAFALPHVVEAITNHLSGHKGGVGGIYNRACYASQMREALELWGKHIAELVAEHQAKSIPVRRVRKRM